MSIKPALKATLEGAPRIGDWLTLRMDAAGRREWQVHSGKVEIGQGIHTALRQIAASALGEDMERVQVAPVSTASAPDEGTTSGSRSVEDGGALVAAACHSLMRLVRTRAGNVQPDADLLTLIEPGDFAQPVDAALAATEFDGRWIGHDVHPAQTLHKLSGARVFVHDLTIDGMLHARVLRGPWHLSVALNAEQLRQSLPDSVQWFRDGDFIALLCDDEDRLVKAWKACREAAEWSATPLAQVDPNDAKWLTQAPAHTTALLDEPGTGASPASRHQATYSRPYLSHASIGPSCALADRSGDKLVVWTHSQAIFNLRAEIAGALALPLENLVLHHVQGAGCYGHNGADDAAFDAALIAWNLKRPVRVQWMREDEFSCAPFGPATVVRLSATLTNEGRIADWQFDAYGAGHHSRPSTPTAPRLLAAWQRENALPETLPGNLPMSSGGGAERNSIPLYSFDGAGVRVHRILNPPVRSSSLRSLGAFANVFAIECFMDELALAGAIDPAQLRFDHLKDVRAEAVLRDAIARAPWGAWRKSPPAGCGIGCAVARYKGTSGWCAVVACVAAEDSIRVLDLYVSADIGTVVNPDGARSQIEGGAMQATSWAVCERVGFDAHGVATPNWETYPILRFSDAPAVHVNMVPRPGEPAFGAGELAQGPTAAAIGNALSHALGVRVRDLPFTFERVAQAIAG